MPQEKTEAEVIQLEYQIEILPTGSNRWESAGIVSDYTQAHEAVEAFKRTGLDAHIDIVPPKELRQGHE